MCFKGKELRLRNPYQECIQGSPKENQFDKFFSASACTSLIIR